MRLPHPFPSSERPLADAFEAKVRGNASDLFLADAANSALWQPYGAIEATLVEGTPDSCPIRRVTHLGDGWCDSGAANTPECGCVSHCGFWFLVVYDERPLLREFSHATTRHLPQQRRHHLGVGRYVSPITRHLILTRYRTLLVKRREIHCGSVEYPILYSFQIT